MSNRDLAAAAAIVWGVAVLVGVFIAAPLLLGLDVNVGLIVNALAAVGAFAAAVAAVWVATSDRRDRKRERDAADEAEAKLVLVSPHRSPNPLELQISVTNCGTKAIVDLTFISLVVEGHPDLDDLRPTMGPFPVIAPPIGSLPHAGPLAGSSTFMFNPESESYGRTHPYFIAVRGGPNNEPQTITGQTVLSATIRWTDASGKTWHRSGTGPADASKVELGTPVRIGA